MKREHQYDGKGLLFCLELCLESKGSKYMSVVLSKLGLGSKTSLIHLN